MAEYIDKEDLYQYLDNEVEWNTNQDRLLTLEVVSEFDSADVAPVKHGKWIHNDEWWEFICTSCYRGIGNIKKYKYCPYCGAKMDGDINAAD